MGESNKPETGLQPIYQVIGFLDRHARFPLGSLLLGGLSAVYLANPTAGVLELIPDNLPFVGNLDEVSVTFLLVWSGANVVRWVRVRRAQRRARVSEKSEEER